ncbi:rhodanese-like domain-containing protein [Gallaecimonas sp. GXIMD4217]|uniref:rhodanese-like domain-containing protein n=1 Tax=Gallaecimonas sp. GXIMD4217 TaxID=3131927 RepID=UPI00311B3EC8
MQHSSGFLALVQSVMPGITEVTVEQLAEAEGVIIDVREDHEWDKGHLPGAVHLGRGIIERDIEQRYPDRDTPLYLYCGGGYRSALSAHNLQQMGYRRVYSVAGGFKAWLTSGRPVSQD